MKLQTTRNLTTNNLPNNQLYKRQNQKGQFCNLSHNKIVLFKGYNLCHNPQRIELN